MSRSAQRLQSLDVLRGLTVAGMILVNNGYGDTFEMLRHSRWNGLTPCDLVFPFFLFIVGIACYLSLSKDNFRPTPATLWHVARRAVLLVALGLFLNWLEMALHGHPSDLGHLRYWAVLQRIGVCYLLVSLFALYVPHHYTLPTVCLLLVAYAALLVWGHGYDYDAQTNLLARVDHALFGYDHLYHKSPVDPEGLVGTLSSTAHVLIGFHCGYLVKSRQAVTDKVICLFVAGTLMAIGGWLLSYALPLNKRVWSPSYVLVTCGLAALLQALLMERIDRHRPQSAQGQNAVSRTYRPFAVFGVNALAIYVASELLSVVLKQVGVSQAVYTAIHTMVQPDRWASLLYALYFVALNYLIGYLLYRRRIFIKL